MRTRLLAGFVVVLLVLSACSGAGPPGEPVSSAEDVVGVWRRTKDWISRDIMLGIKNMHMKLDADGTMGFSRSPDKWDYELCSEEFAFERTLFKVTETTCPGFKTTYYPDNTCTAGGSPHAVYEIQLLGNGNLKFVKVQDDCQFRREILTLAEWEPVP